MIWTRQTPTGSVFYELSLLAPLLSQAFTAIGVVIAVAAGRDNLVAAAAGGGPFILGGLLFGAFFFSLVSVTGEDGQLHIARFALLGGGRESHPARELRSVGVESKTSYSGRQRQLLHQVVLRFADGKVTLGSGWDSYRPAVEDRARRLAEFLGATLE